MTDPYVSLFKSHPDPMWVYDLETLKFLEVNAAAVARYGYSEDEFLLMSINDIRPSEDVPALTAEHAGHSDGVDESGIWRHRLKSGAIFYADTRACPIEFRGRKARLVCARDVTRVVELEQENRVLLEREKAARADAEASALRFQKLFESAPGKYLVLRAADLSIAAASDGFLESTLTRRVEIIGRDIFEVFPDDPSDPKASSVQNLSASIRRVVSNRAADVMPVYRYPIPRPSSQGGGFTERYWTAVNAPVMGPEGLVAFIIHRVDDVTEFVTAAEEEAASASVPDGSNATEAQRRLAILLHMRELKEANESLRDRDRQLTNAQRIGNLGSWELNLGSNVLSWSENVYKIFGTTAAKFGHTFEHFLELVHPDDRAKFLSDRTEALDGRKPFDVVHRILRPDGEIRFVHEIAELIPLPSGALFSGAVRDITEVKVAEARTAEATFLNRAASRSARLGAWSVRVGDDFVTWSDETAAIHELPPGTRPTVQEAIDYYAPEYRASIETQFRACLADGTAFDSVLQVLTKTGRRVWVRAIGEADRDPQGSIVGVYGALQDISELIEAREESHRVSGRLLRNIDNISDGFVTLDPELRFTFVNREATRVLGREVSDLIGRNLWDAFPEGVGTVFDAQYAFAMETRTPVSFVEYFSPLEKWLNVRAYPTDDGLTLYFQDVTGQRAQQEQMQLLQTAISRLHDIVVICEADAMDEPGPRIVYVNDAFEKTTGYRRDEVLGRSPRFLQGPGTDRSELDRIRSALVDGEPVRAEILNYAKDAREYWLELEIAPIIGDDGMRTHFVAVERDVTARKNAENAIAMAQERFRLIARATSDVVWDWDVVNDTVWWNDGFRKLFGYDPDPISRDFSAAIHEDDRQRFLTGIVGCLTEGRPGWSDEYRFRRADGTYATIRDHAFVIRDEAGRAVRMVGSMVDVTNQRKLEEELRQAQKLEAVGQLTGGIAHDFNNLLTVILGNSDTLVEGLRDDDDKRPLMEMTRMAAQRAAELTSRLLSFGRRQALNPRPTDLNRLIVDMEGLLRRTLGEHLVIKIVSDPELQHASVDAAQLENALLNMCLNSRDAMPNGGRLTIETANKDLDDAYVRENVGAVAGSYVMVAVSDTGAGMDAATLARAFEPFYTTKEVGEGSGLGLSMVYGFVKQSNGHVNIYSEPGRGTTIRLYLPIAVAQPEIVADQHSSQPVVGGSAKILLVEDDDLVRDHVARQLEALGYLVVRAEHGQAGLNILQQTGDFALLMTDIVMPGGMNGRQLADAARALYPELRILFTSGYAENALVHKGRLDPGVHLLSKPYRRKDLALKVREVLDA